MVYCCSHQSRCLLYIIWDNRTAICLERGFLHVPVRRSFFFLFLAVLENSVLPMG